MYQNNKGKDNFKLIKWTTQAATWKTASIKHRQCYIENSPFTFVSLKDTTNTQGFTSCMWQI
jgi:hypothetical protein